MSVQVGHGANRERWVADVRRRVLSLRSIGPGGQVTDRLPAILASGSTRDTPLTFDAPGPHLLVIETSHATSTLLGPRFEEYLAEEGLTEIQALRRRLNQTVEPGREIYSRRAKTLIQVGPYFAGADSHVTRPLGLTLELTPERNPYRLRPGQSLPVRVDYQGRPLAGATIKLYDLDADARPVATQRSDRHGRVRFTLPRPGGRWLLSAIWSRPITGDPRGDYDTTFSSLAFGWPAPAAATPST